MPLPAYFLPRPPMHLDDATVDAFERLFAASITRGTVDPIEYRLSAPKWQFLCYIRDQKRVVLHGSGDPSIAELVPRQGRDTLAFGAREAVYAADDGIWPIFYAVVSRNGGHGSVTSMVNTGVRIVAPDAVRGDYYYFSIDADPTTHSSWRNGWVYLLSGQTFERQSLARLDGFEIESTQLASLTAVLPLAKLAVAPSDFPFLHQVRRHDPVELRRRMDANPHGFPWLHA